MEQPPRPLTYAEAQDRARLLEVSGYTVHLDLMRGADVFGSTTVVRFGCVSPGADTFIEIRADLLTRAVLNGRELDRDAYARGRLRLDDLQTDNELVVEADLPYVTTGDGMHRFVDPIDKETYVGAYVGVDNAQRVFANFDQPDLKATIAVSVTAPAQWAVVGNGRGRLVSPEEGRWEFATTPPLSSYLFVVVAGPLHSVEREHRGISFALHCRRSLASHLDAESDEIFAITHACFDRYAELFSEPYAFDSYDQAFVPELNWGAMEMPGCITYRDDFVYRSAVTETERQTRAVVIAHEMAHMWFGDLVTMAWWDDLWLSESFAEYMGFQVISEVTRFTDTWTQFAMSRKTWGYDADQRPSTHPVAAAVADVQDTEAALANFDGISYAKGASALRQLVAWLGEDGFLAGVNDFLGRHRFGVATLDDLLDSLESASGRHVHVWAEAWLRTSGVDTLRLVDDAPGVRVEHPGVRPHRISVGLYDRASGSPERLVLRHREHVELESGATSVRLDLPAGQARPELLLVNDGDLTYSKIRLDDRSRDAVAAGLSGIADPLSRAVAWTNLRDLVRDGVLAPNDYLDLASRHLRPETEVAVVDGVLRFARSEVVDHYLESGRDDALRLLGETCRQLLARPSHPPVDGLRLVAARYLIDCALNGADIGDLRGWLETGAIPGGPPLDPDLRWRVLLRLSILGAADVQEIETELNRDQSGHGPQRAATCQAAIPRLAAKEAAWDAMFVQTAQPAPSTYLLEAAAQGFWQPEQSALLAPFVERYFPAVVDASARRGAAVASALGGTGFPFHVIDTGIATAAERCLAYGEPTAALRRVLTDRLDDYRRAMRVQSSSD